MQSAQSDDDFVKLNNDGTEIDQATHQEDQLAGQQYSVLSRELLNRFASLAVNYASSLCTTASNSAQYTFETISYMASEFYDQAKREFAEPVDLDLLFDGESELTSEAETNTQTQASSPEMGPKRARYR